MPLGVGLVAAVLGIGGSVATALYTALNVAGQAITLMWLPWSTNWANNFAICSIAFVAFRFFDVIKPPPARRLQKIHGGAGILVDDLIAGLYALGLTHIIVRSASL